MPFLKAHIPWNKGKKHPAVIGDKNPMKRPEIRKKVSELMKGNKRNPHTLEWKTWMSKRMSGNKNAYYGKKHTEEIKAKMRGENNGNWKGGISSENHLIRESSDYKLWRETILKRDNFHCVQCGLKRGWNKKLGFRVLLEVDHIKPFALFPELRFSINNGRSLCKDCHKNTPTYGVNKMYLVNKF